MATSCVGDPHVLKERLGVADVDPTGLLQQILRGLHGQRDALFGIGSVNGEARWRTVVQVLGAWVITLPVAALLAAAMAAAQRAWSG